MSAIICINKKEIHRLQESLCTTIIGRLLMKRNKKLDSNWNSVCNFGHIGSYNFLGSRNPFIYM